MSGITDRYCTVIYTDGKKFLAPIKFGRIASVADLPKAKFVDNEYESNAVQAALALFSLTAIRIDASMLSPMGVSSIDENFELDTFYIKVAELPEISSLRCNKTYKRAIGDQRVPTIDRYQYIAFNELDNYTFAIKGMKNVLEQASLQV